MKKEVCFAYREQQTKDMLAGRPKIFEKLKNRGLEPRVTVGPNEAFFSNKVSPTSAEPANILKREPASTLTDAILEDSVGVIVNRSGRWLKPSGLPPLFPAVVNENSTRALSTCKDTTYRKVLKPLGLGIDTLMIHSEQDISRFLDEHTEPMVIVKRNNGFFSHGLQSVSRNQLKTAFNTSKDMYGKYIVQPKCDFTASFPESVQPYDANSKADFDTWNRDGVVKELRMYSFHSYGVTTTFPVARVPSEDEWFFVDPDRLPPELVHRTSAVASRVATVSGAAAFIGAVDFGYGAFAQTDPQWHVIEANLSRPYVVEYSLHEGVADVLRTQYADMIARTVDHGDIFVRGESSDQQKCFIPLSDIVPVG